MYCDNAFTPWVNGTHVATDPIASTLHQAVRTRFKQDGTLALTDAIQCEANANKHNAVAAANEDAVTAYGLSFASC